VDGAREVLAALAGGYRLVGILTGRRSGEVAALLDVPRVQLFGLYGLEGEAPGLTSVVASGVADAAAVVPEAWVEDKGVSLAVHYRQASDPAAARSSLLDALAPVAADGGLELIEGKMVLELVPPGRPMKGGAVERLAARDGLDAVLYAGDDHADLDAFAALDRLGDKGTRTVKVAVRGPETPGALTSAADVVVDGPAGLVGLLAQLA
jgi:trehalose 6-phosphate phosphatase